MTLSSTMARTCVGNIEAYVSPSSVPYDWPMYVSPLSPRAMRRRSMSRAASTVPT